MIYLDVYSENGFYILYNLAQDSHLKLKNLLENNSPLVKFGIQKSLLDFFSMKYTSLECSLCFCFAKKKDKIIYKISHMNLWFKILLVHVHRYQGGDGCQIKLSIQWASQLTDVSLSERERVT